MSAITSLLTFIKKSFKTGDTITQDWTDNVETGIKNSQDALKLVDTELTSIKSNISTNTSNIASNTSNISTNTSDITNLKNNKIDSITLSGTTLTVKANGTTKTTITLPSGGGSTVAGATEEQAQQIATNTSNIATNKTNIATNKTDITSLKSRVSTLESSSGSTVDTSSFFNNASLVSNQLKLMNGSNVLKTVDLSGLSGSGSSGSGSLPDSEYLVRDLIRDYGAKGDGVKRSIKSVDSSVTLSEVQALRSDATLDDQWDWYALQRAINDIAEGKYHKLFIPKVYGGDGNNMYMISKSIRIPRMAMRFIEGNMSVIEQITDNEFILEFKEEDTWGCSFENLYLRYTNPQKAGKTKSIAIAFNPDANKVQGGN